MSERLRSGIHALVEEWRAPHVPWRERLPGILALGLLVLPVSLWTLWSVAELFFEGWWGPLAQRLLYLIPMIICLTLTVVVLRWPRAGGMVLVAAGALFSAWWWPQMLRRAGGALSGAAFLSLFAVSGIFVVTGGLWYWEGRRLARLNNPERIPRWIQRARWVIGLGLPLVIGVGVLAYHLPVVLLRVDRGERSAVRIQGNGVDLVWAPEGPGWARGAGPYPEGGRPVVAFPGWDALAWYGRYGLDVRAFPSGQHATAADMAATGLCRYLNAEGKQLMQEPQDVWRMPTVEEIVRSLVWRGENAGCSWDGGTQTVHCRVRPDKDWPLWATDWSPVYYWAADEASAEEAWVVSSTGFVAHQPKHWGNSRHGFRCVREPDALPRNDQTF
ncbi:MAG: hypothetical protein Kow0077_08960 [Anaerolineae bacterium]